MIRRALPLALTMLLAGSPAAAQSPANVAGPDYAAESTDWNGLARLIALAKGLGLEVETTDSLDWNELGSEDILFMLYPRTRIEPSFLAAFVRNGGRVLLADDYGDSHEALGRLGMLRERVAGVDAERYHADRAYAPIARAWKPNHPLAKDVEDLITNHPAVLRDVKGADVVFGFGENEGVVAAGSIGDGLIVVLSDPSVLINRMMEFGGNLQFTVNVLRYLARPGKTKRLVVLAADFQLWGEPKNLLDDGTLGGRVDTMMMDFNRWLDGRNDYLLTKSAILGAAITLGLGLAVLAIIYVSTRVKNKLDGSWTRAADPIHSAADFQSTVAYYDRKGSKPSYTLPAAILRDTVNARLERVLEHSEPIHTLSEDELQSLLHARCGADAASAIRGLHRKLRALPSRVQATSPWTMGYLSRHEFERLHADVERFERTLGGP
ncbi:MAG TPA: DUF4350 domain-containing protein [Kofleriaceae bacterium]|nr:DUF4350 domain-containing protein [Kofleriaceae bacterium]